MKGALWSAVLTMVACAALAPGVARAEKQAGDGPQLYALYCWSEDYVRYAEDIQKVGLRWLRCGGWDERQWSDKAALLAARNGVNLVPVLYMKEIAHEQSLPADAALKRWREVVRDSVQRYGPGGALWQENKDVPAAPIRYWEIWNEPNIEFLTPPEGMLRTELYARLLQAAAEEIRKLDPGAKIIAFNTAGGVPDRGQALKADGMFQQKKYIGWRKFIRDVVAAAGANCFDVVGTHPYCQPLSPEAGKVVQGVEMTREVARELKFQDKPVWFTEVGWPLEYPGNKQVRDERQQACFVARLFAGAAAHGVAQVQIMYIDDIIYSKDNSRRAFGFFTAPGKWRQQATATRVMIRLLPDPRKEPKILSEEAGEQAGVFAYRFQGANGWPVIMAWNAGDGQVERQFKVDGKGATLVEMLGKTEPLAVGDGQVKVRLSEAPIYIVPATQDEVDKLLKD